MEATFQEVRRCLGFETQKHWSERAVRRTAPALLAVFSVGLCAASWWAYFDVVVLAAERRLTSAQGDEQVRLARDSYSYLHLLMVAGIILVALGALFLDVASGIERAVLGDGITFSSGGVSRTPSSRSNRRAPLGQRSTTVVIASGSALSGCIQGRFSVSKTSGRPLTHSLAWMQRCRSNETVIFSERYAFLALALPRLILRGTSSRVCSFTCGGVHFPRGGRP
jgi:hypothetical protein